jgi:hypothetical protein
MEHANIIKTDIVNNKYDLLWDDVGALLQDATPRPVLVIVSNCEKGSAEDVQLLKMLDACKLLPNQYNIIRLQEEGQVAWHRLREQTDATIIFLIGVLPVQLGISARFVLHEPNSFNDRVWLPTVAIKELEADKNIKTHLWNSGMKPVFVDKKYGPF